jgi:uroporphyrinogen decarboxylase
MAHQETDRVPMALVCSGFEGRTRVRLAEHLRVDPGEGVEHWLEQFLDVAVVGDVYRGESEQYRGPEPGRSASGGYEDIWGVWREPVSYGGGVYYEISRYPLAGVKDVGDLAKHRWPEVDWWDYSAMPELIARATARRDYALVFPSGNPFERTWWMRGLEQTLVDLVERPELFHAIMERVTGFYGEQTRRALAASAREIEFAFTADDIAGQTGMLMSLPMWEEHVKPYHVRLNRVIHEFGTKVMYHSDGGVMGAVPGLMEAGVDVLQALQFSAAGMEPAALKQRYGDRLCFEGGVSVQTTLPFGTVEEVRQEVGDLVRILGRNGGYILGPSHAIQDGTPPDNIVAMLETAAGCGMGGGA